MNTAGSCANGANNPPACNTCTAPQVWNSSSASCVNPNPLSVSVSPDTYSSTLSGGVSPSVSAVYTLTNGTSANTNCRLLDNNSVPLNGYEPCDGTMSVNPPDIVGPYLYFIQANKSSTGETVSDTFTVTVNDITPGAMFGTLVAPSCAIPLGGSSCNTSLTWTTTNPEGTSKVTSNTPSANTEVGSGNSGSGVSANVPYSSRTFFLNNNGKSLVPTSESPSGSGVVATASCVFGTSWDGSINQCKIIPTPDYWTWGPCGLDCIQTAICNDGPDADTNLNCLACVEVFGITCSRGIPQQACTGNSCPVGGNGVCGPVNETCVAGDPSEGLLDTIFQWNWTCTLSGIPTPCSKPKPKPIFIED